FSSVQALMSLGNGAKLAAPALVKALSDQSPNVREYAFYCLQNMGEDAVPALKENLKSKDVKTRINTASLMLRLGIDPQAQEAAVEVLRAGLKEKDDTLKQQAAVALALSGREGKAVMPILLDGLKNPEATIRLQSAQALANLGGQAEGAGPALIALLKDKD